MSLGEEELAVSKNGVMGQVCRMTLPSLLLGKQPSVSNLLKEGQCPGCQASGGRTRNMMRTDSLSWKDGGAACPCRLPMLQRLGPPK